MLKTKVLTIVSVVMMLFIGGSMTAQTVSQNFIAKRYGSFSVIGDSYSTFMGFTEPLGNAQWYPHAGNAMASVNQTWWKMFENNCGIKLEQNNSYSGSTICTHSWNNTTDLVNSFVGRVGNLREAGLIIVEGATNDNNAGSTLGQYVYSDFTDAQKRTFRGGTAYVIDYLQKKYPESQVIFMLNNGLRDDINTSVEEICNHYNVPLLKLHDIGKIEDHPTTSGMLSITRQLEQFLCELNNVTYINEEENQTFATDIANADVLVSKPLRKNQWASICLPFDMSADLVQTTFGEGTLLRTLSGYADGAIEFTATETIEAHKPYLIKSADGIDESFSVSGVDIKAGTPATITIGTAQMYGVYEKTNVRKGQKTTYAIAPNGTLYSAANRAIAFTPMNVIVKCDEAITSMNLEGHTPMSMPQIDATSELFIPVQSNSLHLPAIPVITADPHLTFWSQSEKLADTDLVHINNVAKPIRAYIEVDGKLYRLMGTANAALEKKLMGTTPEELVAEQKSVNVTATQTYYTFVAGGVEMEMVFVSPQVLTDATSFDAAVNYILYKVNSTDGQQHNVKVHMGMNVAVAMRNGTGTIAKYIDDSEGISLGVLSNSDQNMVEGTDANWGCYSIMADAERDQSLSYINAHMIFSDNLGTGTSFADYTLIGHDENNLAVGFGYARFPAPWTLYRYSFNEVMTDYALNIENRVEQCRQFDALLYHDAFAAGGKDYAELCQSVYRQSVTGLKRAVSDTGKTLLYSVDANGTWQMNNSDQNIGVAPLLMAYNPQMAYDLFEATPDYIAMFPFYSSPYGNAPHHLGVWPIMAGSNLDHGVDATTNTMILAGGAIKSGVGVEQISDYSYNYLKSIVDYIDLFTLSQYQANFPNEGSADGNTGIINDYANLRIKAVISMQLMADIAKAKGNTADEEKYLEMAGRWKLTLDSYLNGDYYKQGSNVAWGQKYPLFFDYAFNLNLFSDMIKTETAYYKTKDFGTYGLQLDSRSELYGKVHASLLTAVISGEDFDLYLAPIIRYVNDCTTQRPIADVYNCNDGTPKSGYASVALGSAWAKVLSEKLHGTLNSIDNVVSSGVQTPVNDAIYDLSGRRINGTPKKGIYIVGGKKVVY